MARLSGADAIRRVVEPLVKDAGLFLEDVHVLDRSRPQIVQITVDLPEDELGGVGMDAIAEVSRRIAAALDEADYLAGAYTLEVSSPGVSRPLTELRHFKRARGHLVKIKTLDGRKVTGRITQVDDGVHLDCDNKTEVIALDQIVKGVVQVEMSRIMESGAESDGDQTSEPTQEEA